MRIKINDYSIEPSRFIAGTKGSYGGCSLEFEFAESWDGLAKKVIFSTPRGDAFSVVITEEPIQIPKEVMSCHGRAKFAVVGYKDEKIFITVAGEIDILNTLEPDGENTVTPTESEMAQALEYMESAVSTANEVKTRADSGEFRGDKWFFGNDIKSAPAKNTLEDAYEGDLYLNTDTFDLFRLGSDEFWGMIGNIKGEPGESGAGAVAVGEPVVNIEYLLDTPLPYVKVGAKVENDENIFTFNFGLPVSEIPSPPTKYSVRFTDDITLGTREDAAVGLVAEVSTEKSGGMNDFDTIPIFNRPLCNCTWDEINRRWINNGYVTDATWDLYGENGNVMYECTPFYISDDTDLNSYVSVSDKACEGYHLAPMFKNYKDKVYLSAFKMGTYNGSAASVAKVGESTGSLNSLMEKARGVSKYAHLETIEQYYSELVLMLVEYADKNLQNIMYGAAKLNRGNESFGVQDVIPGGIALFNTEDAMKLSIGSFVCVGTGAGKNDLCEMTEITSVSEYDNFYSTMTFDGFYGVDYGCYVTQIPFPAGISVSEMGTEHSSGSPVSNTSGTYPCIWRGKENPWGNTYSVISDLLGVKGEDGVYKLWYLPDPTKYAGGVLTSDYVETECVIPSESGYIGSLSADPTYGFVISPKDIASTSTSGFAGYHKAPTSDVCAVMVGGCWYEGDKCGVCFDFSFSPDTVGENCSGRLCVD